MSASEPLNPYAPPALPAELDFREAAVLESLRLWEANPGRSAEDLGISLVLPADESGPAWLRHIGRMTVVRLVLGIAGLLIGALLAAVSGAISQSIGVPSGMVIALAAPFSIGGIVILAANVIFARRTVRRGVGQRYLAVERHSTLRRPLCVGVEDSRTFSKMKIAPEDMAWIAFDSASRRLLLEGLIFRYLIQAADVVSVEQVVGGASTGVQVVFRVGTAVVGITLQYDSVWNEFKKQTIGGGRDPLLQPIREALGLK
jgi:hypothetical protein